MTYSGPGGDPFGGDPFGASPPVGHPTASPFGAPGPGGAGFPTPPAPPEDKLLGTLSVVFAFIFPPAGAVLGHVAMTKPDSRTRGLVGMTLSYSFIAMALIASLVWALTKAPAPTAMPTAAPAIPAAPAPTTTTTTTVPPAPTVAQADLPGLLPSLDEIRTIMGVPDLATARTVSLDSKGTSEDGDKGSDRTYDTEECHIAIGSIPEEFYRDNGAQFTHFRLDAVATAAQDVGMTVSSFPDAAMAQKFVTTYAGQWQQCAGRTVTMIFSDPWTTHKVTVGTPTTVDGITELHNTIVYNGSAGIGYGVQYMALAAQANIAIEVFIGGQKLPDETTTITNRIRDRIRDRIPS